MNSKDAEIWEFIFDAMSPMARCTMIEDKIEATAEWQEIADAFVQDN